MNDKANNDFSHCTDDISTSAITNLANNTAIPNVHMDSNRHDKNILSNHIAHV